jgi:hypothetical protein
MPPPATIKSSDLVRLRNEYEDMARASEQRSRDPGNAGLIHRGKAACYRGVVADLNDLINHRSHPSGRRS